MRIINAVLQDVRFQFRHGFYFLYSIMIIFYIIIMGVLPDAWKGTATDIILLTDPAALGFFFIGGILLLEKGDRVLDALFVSPLRVWEYIMAKAISMGFISVIAGLIIAFIGTGPELNIPLIIPALLIGSVLFTFVGLAAGIKAKTVNQFMIITVPAEVLLSTPPFILLFGAESKFLEVMPGSLLFRLFQWCTGHYSGGNPFIMLSGLLLWTVPAFLLANNRMNWFMSVIGGETHEARSKTS